MKWFGKKKEEVLAPQSQQSGLFSTHNDLGLTMANRAKALQAAFAKSFQKTPEHFVAMDSSGQVVSGMDSICNGIGQGSLNGMYDAIPEAQALWYGAQGFIGYQMAALISQHWLVDKACTMPAKDAMRHGYEITVNDGTEVDTKVLDYMRQLDKKFGINKQCVEFVRNGRVFGIRIAMFVVESSDPKYYEKPFNPDGVTPGSYKGISQIDPYWITPELDLKSASNPASMHFYEPTWWRVNAQRVHRSHLIIFRNGELPDILKPTYLYGGIPVPQKIAERVYAAERTANEAPMLAMTKRMTVLKIDTTQMVTDQTTFDTKMAAWTQLMNNYGVKVIDKTNEDINQFDTSLNDLDAVIMTQYQIVAAASGVPATKLLGTSPKGFNATGEFEEASYHEELESLQEHDLSPFIERHHLLLIRSYVAPKFGIQPFDTQISWKPVDSPTAEELAALNKQKADTDAVLVNTGAIDGVDVRARLIADKDSGYNGLVENIPDEPNEPDDDAINADANDSLESLSERSQKKNNDGRSLDYR